MNEPTVNLPLEQYNKLNNQIKSLQAQVDNLINIIKESNTEKQVAIQKEVHKLFTEWKESALKGVKEDKQYAFETIGKLENEKHKYKKLIEEHNKKLFSRKIKI